MSHRRDVADAVSGANGTSVVRVPTHDGEVFVAACSLCMIFTVSCIIATDQFRLPPPPGIPWRVSISAHTQRLMTA